MADVLLQFGVEGVTKATANAQYSLSDSSIRHIVYESLNVVAKHLNCDASAAATVEAPSS